MGRWGSWIWLADVHRRALVGSTWSYQRTLFVGVVLFLANETTNQWNIRTIEWHAYNCTCCLIVHTLLCCENKTCTIYINTIINIMHMINKWLRVWWKKSSSYFAIYKEHVTTFKAFPHKSVSRVTWTAHRSSLINDPLHCYAEAIPCVSLRQDLICLVWGGAGMFGSLSSFIPVLPPTPKGSYYFIYVSTVTGSYCIALYGTVIRLQLTLATMEMRATK